MMKVIAVLNRKGGVGKSTLAVHLAVFFAEQGLRVCLLDADGQRSSSKWVSAASPEVHVVTLERHDQIFEFIDRSQAEKRFDLIVADAPGDILDGTRGLMFGADLVVVPCGPSVMDLESTREAIDLFEAAQSLRGTPSRCPALVILNQMRPRRNRVTRQVLEAATVLGLPVCSQTIGNRDAFIDARTQETVVWRLGAEAKLAAEEMLNVMMEILSYGQTQINDGHDGPTTTAASRGVPADRSIPGTPGTPGALASESGLRTGDIERRPDGQPFANTTGTRDHAHTAL